ncbi:RNA polymerase subunit sigma-70 [Bordetella genomosp. 1]|uniref:Regulator of SigK n=1 Tax=Bordetella genomosp. 1 TaxID=1395607 RepID=A0A261RYB8_9BORD|nr:anti-sigma factor [Bordetella genomosp. 1]OZI29273.1 RNA polymerase subunit sigma-70 [Bordetella genomosp. 1]
MTPTDTDDDLHALAGEYVLGTLPAQERQHVQARLPHDAALRDAVAYWEARLAPLNDLVEPQTPPASLWRRISATLDGKRAAPSRAARGGWWHSLVFWRGLSSAALAAALVLASVLVLQPPPAAPQYVVVLVGPQSQAPGWVVQASGADAVQLVPLAAMQVPADRALQFWTKADDWSGPVSLGLVKPGEAVRIPLADLPPLVPNQLFELTLEPATGSPTGRPTGPIQFIGRAVRMM